MTAEGNQILDQRLYYPPPRHGMSWLTMTGRQNAAQHAWVWAGDSKLIAGTKLAMIRKRTQKMSASFFREVARRNAVA